MKENRYEWTNNTYVIKSDDQRYNKYSKIKKETGISPDETWDLSESLCKFFIPRLKLYIEESNKVGTHPGCFKNRNTWVKVLTEILWTFEAILSEEPPYNREIDKETEKRINNGLHLFAKYFRNMWW